MGPQEKQEPECHQIRLSHKFLLDKAIKTMGQANNTGVLHVFRYPGVRTGEESGTDWFPAHLTIKPLIAIEFEQTI